MSVTTTDFVGPGSTGVDSVGGSSCSASYFGGPSFSAMSKSLVDSSPRTQNNSTAVGNAVETGVKYLAKYGGPEEEYVVRTPRLALHRA